MADLRDLEENPYIGPDWLPIRAALAKDIEALIAYLDRGWWTAPSPFLASPHRVGVRIVKADGRRIEKTWDDIRTHDRHAPRSVIVALDLDQVVRFVGLAAKTGFDPRVGSRASRIGGPRRDRPGRARLPGARRLRRPGLGPPLGQRRRLNVGGSL